MNKLYNLTEEDWINSSENVEEIVYQYLENLTKERLLSIRSVLIFEGYPLQRSMKDYIDISYILSMVESVACDEVGVFAEGWLDCTTAGQRSELSEMINMWANKHKLQPSFHYVDEVTEIEVEVSETVRNEVLKLFERDYNKEEKL